MKFEKNTILKKIDYFANQNKLDVDIASIEKIIDYAFINSNIPSYLLFGVTDIVLSTICETNIIIASFLYRLKISSNNKNIDIDIDSKALLITDEVINLRNKIYFTKILTSDIKKFHQFLLSLITDVRSLIIVLADFLYHMQIAKKTESLKRQKQIVQKAIEIIIPLAKYLGIEPITQNLQDTVLSIAYPDDLEHVTEYLENLEKSYSSIISSMIPKITRKIHADNIPATVTNRKKNIYSIWEKTLKKNYNVDSLDDLIGLRVIVNTIEECYQVLGIIHTSYNILQDRFHDYISVPKINGYQSIHTVITGLSEFNIEIQIRTKQMDFVAKSGIASHWLYKSKESFDQYRWIRKLQKKLYFQDHTYKIKKDKKLALYYDRLFCFSTSNKIITLNAGSNVMDFAFNLGEEFGKYFCKAKVNGKFVSPDILLSNGDKVEIILSDIPKAEDYDTSYDDINSYEKYSRLGQIILNNICTYLDIENNYKFQLNIVNKIQVQYQDLLYDIGRDEITIHNLIDKISEFAHVNKRIDLPEKETSTSHIPKIILTNITYNTKQELAFCCMPIPGEPIIAINSPGNRTIIHTRKCKVVNKFLYFPNSIINAYWNPDATFDTDDYSCKMQIKFNHSKSILSNIINYISMYKIIYVKYMSSSSDLYEVLCTIKIKNSLQFNYICHYLLKRINVTSATKYIA